MESPEEDFAGRTVHIKPEYALEAIRSTYVSILIHTMLPFENAQPRIHVIIPR